jgi:hypothetical protein
VATRSTRAGASRLLDDAADRPGRRRRELDAVVFRPTNRRRSAMTWPESFFYSTIVVTGAGLFFWVLVVFVALLFNAAKMARARRMAGTSEDVAKKVNAIIGAGIGGGGGGPIDRAARAPGSRPPEVGAGSRPR